MAGLLDGLMADQGQQSNHLTIKQSFFSRQRSKKFVEQVAE